MQGMPNKITDQDLYTTLLNEHKHMAAALVHAVLETGDQTLRRDFQDGLNKALDHQYQIWQQMSQKGYYKPLPAGQQGISQLQQDVQKMTQQLPGNWQTQGQTQTTTAGNWPPPNVT